VSHTVVGSEGARDTKLLMTLRLTILMKATTDRTREDIFQTDMFQFPLATQQKKEFVSAATKFEILRFKYDVCSINNRD
jgi:hypothetical protein